MHGKGLLFVNGSDFFGVHLHNQWVISRRKPYTFELEIYILNYPGKKDHPLWHFPVMLCLTSNHGYILLGSRLVEVAPKCPSV